jgi:hypothetical protein
MAESLEETKERLSQLYLGRGGIHGVGLRRSENAVTVYLDAGGGEPPAGLVGEMERAAAPFRLLVIDERSPRIT